MNLGDRVLSAPHRAEAVADRLEARLENRLQDQHQGSLHEPVHRDGYPQPPELPRLPGLRDQALPDRQRGERPRSELLAGVAQEGRDVGRIGDEPGNHPVHARRARSLVAPHPFPRDHKEVRMTDEVEQIIKPAAGVPGRPVVQLGLHPPYPLLRREQVC